jgi:hypothetical protein
MTDDWVTSVVIWVAAARLLIPQGKFYDRWLNHICSYMSSGCTPVNTSNENSMTDGWVTSAVIWVAARLLIPQMKLLWQIVVSQLSLYSMSSSCTHVTTSNKTSMTDGWVTSVLLAAAAQLLKFQIRVSVKCFILSVFILLFLNKSQTCFLKTNEDDSISWPVHRI